MYIMNNKYDLTKIAAVPLKNTDVVIVDGMNLFHRFYHIFGKYPYGTAYGFISGLLNFKSQLLSNKFVVCWDGDKNWRKDENDDYKQDREKSRNNQFTDEDREAFNLSLVRTKELLTAVGIIQVIKQDCEADDIIALITLKYDSNVIIVSNDKDFMQLVNNSKNRYVLRPIGKGNYSLFYEDDVYNQFGVKPTDIPKLLAIAGDTSDNVKGVKNFGPVKALQMIQAGQITKDNLRNIFNKEQIKQFVSSYRLVKLGNDKFHHIKISKKDVSLSKYTDMSVYLENTQDVLNKFDIKRITSIECKQIYNLNFTLEFEKRFII